MNVIGTKWVFRNKINENGEITRNKARLVCKGYAQEEGLDYGEKFSPIARMEGVRTLLTYTAYKGFKVCQMDVKSSFLNGILEEEVYIGQLEDFLMRTTRIWSANCIKITIVSNKLLELGMRDFINI